ncbi:MAG: cell division protein FtsQ/DivIB [Spirochaetota bacterium]
MADVLAGERYVSRERPVGRERTAGRERSMQRLLTAIIVLLSIVLVLEVVYHLVLAPRLVIDRIEIESDLPMSDSELLALAGVRVGMPYFRTDPAEITERVLAHPVVRDAQVSIAFPNRISISANRRVPLATAIAQTGEGPVPLVFDEEGVVFQVGLGEGELDLPVVSGLRFAAVDAGLQLPALVVDFLGQLRGFRMNSPELYGLFSEYRIVQRNEYAYEVVLYPMHFPLPVRIGTSIDRDMIQYVLMMLDLLRREGRLESLAELDFRSGEGVLRARTDSGLPGSALQPPGGSDG